VFRRLHLVDVADALPGRYQPGGSSWWEVKAPPIADFDPDPVIADLSPDETRDAMYETAAAVRLDLIYCPHLDGGLRKHWANRLGYINLSRATAASEVQQLRGELARYEADWDDELHREVAKIRHGLWRLRELCLRHQGFARAAAE